MKSILTTLLIVALAVMTSCAMLPTKSEIADPWVQTTTDKLLFTSNPQEKALVFFRITEEDTSKTASLLYITNPNATILAVIIDLEKDKSADEAFVVLGSYNYGAAEGSLPFLPSRGPMRVHPSVFNRVNQDYYTMLELWETEKHISRIEMDNIVEKFFSEEVSASIPSF